MCMQRTYRGKITDLPKNGIFVCGTNKQGKWGKGAALSAKKHFGAKDGKATGLNGRAWGIVTKDLSRKIHPSISKLDIALQIKELYNYAREHQERDFYIIYSGGGENLNGYSNIEMAKLFTIDEIPRNIIFEESFCSLVNKFLEKKEE